MDSVSRKYIGSIRLTKGSFCKLGDLNNIPFAIVCPSKRSDENNPIPGFGRSKKGTRRNYGREERKTFF